MPSRQRILIGCPAYQVYVSGSYPCDARGRFLLRSDGTYDVTRAKCGQRGGHCQEPLCLLNRYNRGGRGTWYPTEILAPRSAEASAGQSVPSPPVEGDLF